MKMKAFKKLGILLGIGTLVLSISAFDTGNAQNQAPKPSNLKVLSKKIDPQDLDKVMKGFNAALGVKCNHCHAPKANGERGLDFASDANPNKNIARSMMKMTSKINKKYFNTAHEGVVQNISCNTCHNGKAKPLTVAQK